MDQPTCTLDGCEKRSRNPLSPGLCGLHYTRQYRHGSVDYVRPPAPVLSEKPCTKCSVVKSMEDFYPLPTATDGHAYRCKDCCRSETREWAKRVRERGRDEVVVREIKGCTKCSSVKRADEFPPSAVTLDRLSAWCRDCHRAARRARGKANRKQETAWSLAWREVNREKYDSYMLQWRSENREACREHDRRWRESNPEVKLECNRRWIRENYEAILAKRAANPEHFREINRRSALKTKDKRSARSAERRATIAGGAVSVVDLESLWTGICGLCGDYMDPDLAWPEPMSKSIDHIMPLSLGGDHSVANLQWAHLFCNLSKGNRI